MFACFYIPDFAVQAALLPELAETRSGAMGSLLWLFLTGLQICRECLPLMCRPARRNSNRHDQAASRNLWRHFAWQTLIWPPRIWHNPTARFCGHIFAASGINLSGRSDSGSGRNGKTVGGMGKNSARNMAAKAADIGFDLRIAIAANPDTAFLTARGFSANLVSRPRPGQGSQQTSFLAGVKTLLGRGFLFAPEKRPSNSLRWLYMCCRFRRKCWRS